MSYFVDYHHLITTRPNDIQQVLISDLHLSRDEPALAQAFLSLLTDLQALPNLQGLYILGDWFDAWIGDDAYLSLSDEEKQSHWLTPLIKQLKQLRMMGCEIFVMHGNRDFLLGQLFCNSFGGALIHEPYPLDIGAQRYRLEHGDALCTDDKAYQRFRKLMRNRLVQWYLLNKTLTKRIKIAEQMRQKSQKSNANKSTYIMDVNAGAVKASMSHYDALLHGHTHRPAVHLIHDNTNDTTTDNTPAQSVLKDASLLHESSTLGTGRRHQNHCNSDSNQKVRYVLGDWRVLNKGSSYQHVEAVIGIVVQSQKPAHQQNRCPDVNKPNSSCLSSEAKSAEFMMVKFTD